MNFTDIFIKRPVLATVISLLILILGLRSLASLSIRQYPLTQNAVITVTTTYTGATPSTVAGFITTTLENSLAQVSGIDYMQSTSTQSTSSISIYLLLNYDANKALSDVSTKVSAVLNQLPKEAQLPVVSIASGETIDSLYIGFYSKILPNNKITDYLIRVVQPKLQSVNGVQQAEIIGGQQFAMRIWLDPKKLAAYNLTASDVTNALAANDFISAVGRTDGNMVTANITAATGLSTVKEFKKLIIKAKNDAIIRIENVATVSLGATNYDTQVSFNGDKAVYVGIVTAPTANLLTVLNEIKAALPDIQQQLPQGLEAKIVYDSSQYVKSSIEEVVKSLVEAILIVIIVIFIFLGSLRSVIIPVIAIPLSLIGAFFIMLVLGYSVNLLTLLALVLGIGLVVDDAIIVVENIHRHMEDGMDRLSASIQGARELANPIIAISIVLIAVYVPIGFMDGLTGALFTEFAFTLAGAVGVSAIVALTLSPMMCSKTLQSVKEHKKPRVIAFVDRQFKKVEQRYDGTLKNSLNYLPVTAVFAAIILTSIYFLYTMSQSELAPAEDQGVIISQLTTAPNASLEQTQLYQKQVYNVLNNIPEKERIFQIDGAGGLNAGITGIGLKPWEERTRTAMQIQPLMQTQYADIAGANIVAFQRPPLPGGGKGLPIQFVVQTTDPFDKLYDLTQSLLDKARTSGMFGFVDVDLKIDKSQTNLLLNRDKIAELGLNMQSIGSALGSAVSERYINYFNYQGRSYQVISQVDRDARINSKQILDYYITAANGKTIPISTFASLKTTVEPESLNHFQQLNSAIISAVPRGGVTMGQALDYLHTQAKEILPAGYRVDYAGQSRQFIQEGNALVVTFIFAIIIIFLALAALFESFFDPLIVLISVPMSICGAMVFICLGVGGATLNIYTEVGLVTLIGLISKHGILIVQFANDLQADGKNKLEAVQMAARIRLRPIVMTTAAMVLGVVPLLLATGAGAVSRFSIGLVIASGISIGTLFTLFVVPAMYMFLAKNHAKTNSVH